MTYTLDTSIPSPSTSGPRLSRIGVHNNRLYLWFQFSHCRALLTVHTASNHQPALVVCRTLETLAQLAQNHPSHCKYSLYVRENRPCLQNVVVVVICCCCCCCSISVLARSHRSSHRIPCSQCLHRKPLGWAECSAGSPRSQRRSPGPGHDNEDNITAT